MSTTTHARPSLKIARDNVKRLRKQYSGLARQVGWNPEPVAVDNDDVDQLVEVTEQLGHLIEQAQVELNRQASAGEQPDHAEAYSSNVDRDVEDVEVPATEVLYTADAEFKPVVEAEPVPVVVMPDEMPTRLTLETARRVEVARQDAVRRKATVVGWSVVSLTAMVLGFLIGSGLANVALVAVLLAVTVFGAYPIAHGIRSALLVTGTTGSLFRVGWVTAGGVLLFGTMGMATATPWQWTVGLAVFGMGAYLIARHRGTTAVTDDQIEVQINV